MIQDIGPKRLDISFAIHTPEPEDRVIYICGGQVLLRGDGDYPAWGQLPALRGGACRYLFCVDGARFFLVCTEKIWTAPGLEWRDVSALRALTPMERALEGFTALHLADWYRANRFCGCCGGELIDGAEERKLVCPACGNQVYPRINPAVIAAVVDGGRLLMTRYAHGPVRRYVLVAGFVEIGETAEQAVAREVFEETGLRVGRVRYFGSQPWGVAGNLTLGYWAELAGDDAVTVETGELSDARWFDRAEVPVPRDETSLTSAMIRAFAAGEEGAFA